MKKINLLKELSVEKKRNQPFLFPKMNKEKEARKQRGIYTKKLAQLTESDIVKMRTLCKDWPWEFVKHLYFKIEKYWEELNFKSPLHMFNTERKKYLRK